MSESYERDVAERAVRDFANRLADSIRTVATRLESAARPLDGAERAARLNRAAILSSLADLIEAAGEVTR